MRSHKHSTGYLLRLDRGEELIATLTAFCKAEAVSAGFFQGLGGVSRATLGYYDLTEQAYSFTELLDLVEIASLTGNVALKDGEPFLHVHATVADTKLRSYSGHVKSLLVGGTCEINLQIFPDKLERRSDASSGLDLLEL